MTVRERLWDVAVDQYGYVTTGDARRLGINRVELAKLAARGALENVSHGVYRFPAWPVSGNDHLMEAVLWTRDPTAVLSHETALDVLELCDVNPDRVHVNVSGRKYPIRRVDPLPALKVHYDDLPDGQRVWWEQIPTVAPAAAIGQGIRSGVRPDLLAQAIGTARRLGMVDSATAARLAGDLEGRYR
ncbi:MAG: type IV toxin-antitoxin system AbiEi family antitoxin domain-containing protein [Propionibacteriaceae bacterium]|nr:type IV toxin-antitoxin system AbiEi family antitoxin domain-containing protein [Propionibacteriaceae bacterium]